MSQPDNPVLKKLRLKSGYRAIVLNAPQSYEPVLSAIPAEVTVESELTGQFDFIHTFVAHKDELERIAPRLKEALKPSGLLWVSYPKGKALPTDLKRDIVGELLARFSLAAVAQVAIDEVWSAIRFKSV